MNVKSAARERPSSRLISDYATFFFHGLNEIKYIKPIIISNAPHQTPKCNSLSTIMRVCDGKNHSYRFEQKMITPYINKSEPIINQIDILCRPTISSSYQKIILSAINTTKMIDAHTMGRL